MEMFTVYLKNKETDEVIAIYDNATYLGENYILINQSGCHGKYYCNDDEYYTMTGPEEETETIAQDVITIDDEIID